MRRLPAAFISIALAVGLLAGCSSEDFDLGDPQTDGDGAITIEGNVIGDELADCVDLTEGTTPGCTGQ